ncbi:hypothetical protein RMAECT_1019 [Rickettsia rhipicephali str. Ect]|uniref:Uncharacterized protein n=1 Tax=Rickettsia rhipicephali str. Ect TaxID=1359199 RepID=A0A0F3PE58_RICRH|nr:hypothetical protein RMAECT_1019 [Rickettsia rhipicephali str. Ect]
MIGYKTCLYHLNIIHNDPQQALNKLIKNFIKTKKYDEIKSILASKNSYNLLGLHHVITSFDLEAYKLIIISYANPSHFTSAKYDR